MPTTYNEVKRLGGDDPTTPTECTTEDQTEIALYWLENSTTPSGTASPARSPPPGTRPLGNARLFGSLNLALADGYIAMFEARTLQLLVAGDGHPEGAEDGNPRTTGDPDWAPLLTTPPARTTPPDTASKAAQRLSRVHETFFGTDKIDVRGLQSDLAEKRHVRLISPTKLTSRQRLSGRRGERSSASSSGSTSATPPRKAPYGRHIGTRVVNLFLRPVHRAPITGSMLRQQAGRVHEDDVALTVRCCAARRSIKPTRRARSSSGSFTSGTSVRRLHQRSRR